MRLLKKLLKSLIALPISTFIIFLAYAFIYISLGSEAYSVEIEALKDISILVKEFLVIAVSMYFAILAIYISYENINKKENKISIKILYMILLIICFAFLPLILGYFLLANLEVFRTVFLIMWLILVAIISLVFIIKDFIDVWLINKKIKAVTK